MSPSAKGQMRATAMILTELFGLSPAQCLWCVAAGTVLGLVPHLFISKPTTPRRSLRRLLPRFLRGKAAGKARRG